MNRGQMWHAANVCIWQESFEMIAILSDIHANLEAMEAVLADAARFNVNAIYCLGDLVGYGPDPIPCILRAMTWDVVLQGNFEIAALGKDDLPGWTAGHARETIFRFRSRLAQYSECETITQFLTSLPGHFATAEALYVHGSPRNHCCEYLYPEDIYNHRKMDAVLSHIDSLCFCGHTHVPGVFRHNMERECWEFVSPPDCDYQYTISDDKLICNIGSVGQPRDGDFHACYVLYEPGKITFRRVDYDFSRTIQKMHDDGDGGL